VVGAEVKTQSPYNYGEVICASVYCGPDVDFGNGAFLQFPSPKQLLQKQTKMANENIS
jgi:hypothetical protein